MSRPRTIRGWLAIAALVALLAVGWRVLPAFTGPSLPLGATRLAMGTQPVHLAFGCAAAALTPVRVATSGAVLELVSVGSGETVPVAWPAGFAAWRVDGRAVLADPWGSVVGREGDVLDSLGGGLDADDVFAICPYGIVTRP